MYLYSCQGGGGRQPCRRSPVTRSAIEHFMKYKCQMEIVSSKWQMAALHCLSWYKWTRKLAQSVIKSVAWSTCTFPAKSETGSIYYRLHVEVYSTIEYHHDILMIASLIWLTSDIGIDDDDDKNKNSVILCWNFCDFLHENLHKSDSYVGDTLLLLS